MFHNIAVFYGEGLLASRPNPQAGGPPLVGYPRLIIQSIRSHSPYLEDIPPSATAGRVAYTQKSELRNLSCSEARQLNWYISKCPCLLTLLSRTISIKFPIPVAARSTARVYGLSIAGITGSNPTGVLDVWFL
jgi:hypothetical protein